jgi:hypothetical protein
MLRIATSMGRKAANMVVYLVFTQTLISILLTINLKTIMLR